MSKEKFAVFTMDVEAFTDTECVSRSGEDVEADLLDGFDEYIKILDRHGIKCTLFTLGRLAPQISGKIKDCISAGHSIALHSYEHIAPIDQTLTDFRDQIKKARDMMSDMFGVNVTGFRAPCFSMDNSRLDILRELGFTYDSSNLGFEKARHTVKLDLSGFDKLRDGIFSENGFFEFEMSKQKILGHHFPISGGGYVRLSSWPFIKPLIRKYISENDYYVFYLHPFELTKKKVPYIKDLKTYDKLYIRRGISTYGDKVEQIIGMLKKCGYRFVTFEQLASIMENESAVKPDTTA